MASLNRDHQRKIYKMTVMRASEIKENDSMLDRLVEQGRQDSEGRAIIEKDRVAQRLLSGKRLQKNKSLSEQIDSLRDQVEQKRDIIEDLNHEVATYEVENEDLRKERDEKTEEVRVSL